MPPLAAPRLLARQSKCQLMRKQFVISEPRRAGASGVRSSVAFGALGCIDSVVEIGPAFALNQGRVDPFSQVRHPRQSRGHRFGHHLLGQPGGERPNRLELGHLGQFIEPQHMVGMDNLGDSVVEFQLARDDPLLPGRQAGSSIHFLSALKNTR